MGRPNAQYHYASPAVLWILLASSFVASSGFLAKTSTGQFAKRTGAGPVVTAGSSDAQVADLTFQIPSSLGAQSISDAIDGNPYQAQKLVFEGMEEFRKGNVDGSIELFDQAEAIRPSITPYLWQRGLSYYYADRFVDASRQFRADVKVNPLDVEEIVWDIASQFRACPEGPIQMMSLPKGQKDQRKIMSTVYSLFRGEGTEQDLAMAGHSSGRPSDEFYALFYLALYCEAKGETTKSSQYMRQAAQSDYANTIGRNDYMTSVARVHCKLRGWEM